MSVNNESYMKVVNITIEQGRRIEALEAAVQAVSQKLHSDLQFEYAEIISMRDTLRKVRATSNEEVKGEV